MLLPIITSENNNAHKHSRTLIWCQPATESAFLFVLLRAEVRPPERSPAAADEPTVVQLQGGPALTSAEESHWGPSLCIRMFRNIRNSKLTSFSSCNSACHALSSSTTQYKDWLHRGESAPAPDSSNMQHW